eukprot:Tamp_29048.p2 GENE.Tamp_29048~~Tamp_29048.p2  ORF type:complete len:151 (-),score=2.45 Tamp_29048:87-539(-)
MQARHCLLLFLYEAYSPFACWAEINTVTTQRVQLGVLSLGGRRRKGGSIDSRFHLSGHSLRSWCFWSQSSVIRGQVAVKRAIMIAAPCASGSRCSEVWAETGDAAPLRILCSAAATPPAAPTIVAVCLASAKEGYCAEQMGGNLLERTSP